MLNHFLELFGADTDGETLGELYLLLAFAWRYQIFLLANGCFP